MHCTHISGEHPTGQQRAWPPSTLVAPSHVIRWKDVAQAQRRRSQQHEIHGGKEGKLTILRNGCGQVGSAIKQRALTRHNVTDGQGDAPVAFPLAFISEWPDEAARAQRLQAKGGPQSESRLSTVQLRTHVPMGEPGCNKHKADHVEDLRRHRNLRCCQLRTAAAAQYQYGNLTRYASFRRVTSCKHAIPAQDAQHSENAEHTLGRGVSGCTRYAAHSTALRSPKTQSKFQCPPRIPGR